MILRSDTSLIRDPKYKVVVEEYTMDQDIFFKDYSAAFITLLENGIACINNDNNNNAPTFTFQTLSDQDM